MTDEEILVMFMQDKALLDEIRVLAQEAGAYQEKCINIGDVVLSSIRDFNKAKQKKHREGLAFKTRFISDRESQNMDGISFDNQRLVGG